MATVKITNHHGPEVNLCDRRGGFSVLLTRDKPVEFDADEGRMDAMMGHLVNLVNWEEDGKMAYTVAVTE